MQQIIISLLVTTAASSLVTICGCSTDGLLAYADGLLPHVRLQVGDGSIGRDSINNQLVTVIASLICCGNSSG